MHEPATEIASAVNELCRTDFQVFIERVFATLDPAATLERSFYLEVLSDRLAAVERGELRRLLITIPPRRLSPIFRDRAELPAADDLGAAIKAALAASGHLIVICSPAAARSRWVDQEVATFKRLHGERCVLALIASGEPYASAQPETADQECFPSSLRVRFGPDGQPTRTQAEPIAADIRPGKDGRRLALLKLVAGLAGLELDDLVQRDAQRRIRRLTAIVVGAVSGMVLAIGLALYANQ